MKRIIFFYGCGLMVSFFMVFTLLNSVRTNPIVLKYRIECDALYYLFPQGWSFFTKNPRESYMRLYRLENNRTEYVNFKNTQLHNLFGLVKSDRVYYYNIYGELANVPVSHFYNSRDKIENINIKKLNTYKVNNTSFEKGMYVAQIQELTPWVWHSEMENVNMPSRYVILNIQ